MRRRRIAGAALAAAAVALIAASTAYACVVLRGDATVDGAVQDSNRMTGANAHDYCPGGEPRVAAAGPPGSEALAEFAPSTLAACPGQLSDGTYDVRLRNTNLGYLGADNVRWVQVPRSGCFAPGNAGANNFDVGDMTVTGGSGSVRWNVPAGATTINTPADASIFCVGKFGPNGEAPTGTSDGFLAPFRVATI